MADIHCGAKLLADARFNHRRLPELPIEARAATPDEAYACQDALVQKLLNCYGGAVIGYKIACTNKIAEDLLHSGPFYGKMFSSFCFDSGCSIKADRFFMRVMEAEFAFQMARDLEPRSQPFTREQVADAVGSVVPGIEIVDSRFDNWIMVSAESLIADNACHGAWIKGQPIGNWRTLDLAAQEVRLLVNGTLNQTGSGAAVLGHPLNALLWLANSLRERNEILKAGQYITTGVTTDIYMAQPGDRVQADFGQIGTVELAFE